CTGAIGCPAPTAGRRCSASRTPRTRRTIARAARPAASSSPTARFRDCCTTIGRGPSTSSRPASVHPHDGGARSCALVAPVPWDSIRRHCSVPQRASPQEAHVYKIAVIPGDGTGPEVTAEAVKVLGAAAKASGFKYETTNFDFGGDRYLKTGEVLPESAVKDLSGFDAILL